jgi:O-acetyl-ADP-ribose deacetylase (regulator of RNase III)
MFAADGRLAIQKVVNKNTDALLESIDLSNLSKGVYFLQLKTATAVATKMVVKE